MFSDNLARYTLKQHMEDCVRRQDKIDTSLAAVREDLVRQDQNSDVKHDQNRKDLAQLRQENADGRQRILFWLLTTASSIIVSMIGVIGGIIYLIVKDGHL